MDELMLACPFCGEQEDLHAYDQIGVQCGSCGAQTGSIGKLAARQIEYWNERVDNSRIKELEEQLKAITDKLSSEIKSLHWADSTKFGWQCALNRVCDIIGDK